VLVHEKVAQAHAAVGARPEQNSNGGHAVLVPLSSAGVAGDWQT
jgi:hypothetical protein